MKAVQQEANMACEEFVGRLAEVAQLNTPRLLDRPMYDKSLVVLVLLSH